MPSFEPTPGETPITDVSELRVKDIRTRSQLNQVEAINITKALARYFGGPVTSKEAPFDYAWFLHLHRELFADVWGWAGRLRTSVTSIGIQPRFIEQALYELSQNLPCWSSEPLLKQATMLHHQAVRIHPFENGNGRWARALANLWLYLHGHEPTDWPGTALSEESPIRAEYIQAIKAADQGDYGPLLALHQRFTPTDRPAHD
jgi:fido (protein-threonine AMPylation protein)